MERGDVFGPFQMNVVRFLQWSKNRKIIGWCSEQKLSILDSR